jgi:hypothetical protein
MYALCSVCPCHSRFSARLDPFESEQCFLAHIHRRLPQRDERWYSGEVYQRFSASMLGNSMMATRSLVTGVRPTIVALSILPKILEPIGR